MSSAINRFVQNTRRLRGDQAAIPIAYATMYLDKANCEDSLVLFLSENYFPDSSHLGFNAEEESALVTHDEFGLIWRTQSKSLVRLGTTAEPLSEDVLDTAKANGVLVFFIDEHELAPQRSVVLRTATSH